ncbi:hypothetical protein Hanom_Chr04g00337201 [Helianthus anomalus]
MIRIYHIACNHILLCTRHKKILYKLQTANCTEQIQQKCKIWLQNENQLNLAFRLLLAKSVKFVSISGSLDIKLALLHLVFL